MAKFRLPPLSPLIGSTMGNFLRVTRSGHVGRPYYLKVTLTFFGVAIGSLLHWVDALYFRKKQKVASLTEPPIFVIGHWRSGTTLMHNLLCTDQDAGFITTYQSVFPNNLRSKWLFKTFMNFLMPRSRPGDNVRLDPDYPQEDEYALSNITTHCFYHSFYFPRQYRTYYDQSVCFRDITAPDYARWKKLYKNLILRALINSGGRHIVLKNPVNTGRIKTLMEIFPDARFIFMHRNPITTYLSSVKFFSNLFPELNLHRFSTQDIKKMVVDNYIRLLKDFLQDRDLIPPEHRVEVCFDTLQENPIETIESIYRKFDLPGFKKTKQALQQYVQTQKRHRMHTYTLAKNEADLITDKFGFAFREWGYDFPETVQLTEAEE